MKKTGGLEGRSVAAPTISRDSPLRSIRICNALPSSVHNPLYNVDAPTRDSVFSAQSSVTSASRRNPILRFSCLQVPGHSGMRFSMWFFSFLNAFLLSPPVFPSKLSYESLDSFAFTCCCLLAELNYSFPICSAAENFVRVLQRSHCKNVKPHREKNYEGSLDVPTKTNKVHEKQRDTGQQTHHSFHHRFHCTFDLSKRTSSRCAWHYVPSCNCRY